MRGDCEFRAVRLPGGRPVAEVLRGFAADRAVVCLRGNWVGGGDLIASEPVAVHCGGDDPLAPMHEQPRAVASASSSAAAASASASAQSRGVGGGWFAVLGYPSGGGGSGVSDERLPTGRGSLVGGSLTGGASDEQPGADVRWQTWLGFYDHLLRWDRVDRTWWFESLWTPERDAELARRQEELTARLTDSAPRWNCRGNYRAGLFTAADATSHLQTVERCISHIRAGDLFQVNAAQRLEADFTGSTIDLFADVSEQLQPARAAYADTGSSVLAGFSPELFLHRRGRTVTTSPIKGTRPRVGVADEHEADVLRGSAKDAAENVMIVDLMRNDLGRVGLPGSVRAPSLLDIEPHPGVWHLVSTVTAELPDEVDDADLLAATFPPGSVTGAPKSSAMRIIDRYEPGGRQAFSGAVGFSSPVYGAEFAVTIRSFQIADDRVGLWVGGGITVDSVPIEEWRECLTKASPLLQAAGFRLRQSATGSREHGTLLPESLVETPVAGVTGPDQLGTGLSVTSQPQPQPQPQSQPQPSRSAVGLSDAAGSGPGPGAARLSDVAGSEPGMARSPEAAAHRPDRSAAGLPDAADGLLETVLVRDGRAVALADHLARLERSCRELYGRPPSELAADVACHAAGETRGRLRIVVRPMADKLDVDITVAPLAGPTGVRRLVTASRPGVVWRHKYADRRWLSAAEHRVGDGALPLFVDVAGQVLETTRGNVFLILGEELLTPPATDAILPGVTRRLVLDAAFDLGVTVRIEPIPLARIHAADGLFTTSAVSEITHIDELDGAALPAAGALERAVADSVLGRD